MTLSAFFVYSLFLTLVRLCVDYFFLVIHVLFLNKRVNVL